MPGKTNLPKTTSDTFFNIKWVCSNKKEFEIQKKKFQKILQLFKKIKVIKEVENPDDLFDDDDREYLFSFEIISSLDGFINNEKPEFGSIFYLEIDTGEIRYCGDADSDMIFNQWLHKHFPNLESYSLDDFHKFNGDLQSFLEALIELEQMYIWTHKLFKVKI